MRRSVGSMIDAYAREPMQEANTAHVIALTDALKKTTPGTIEHTAMLTRLNEAQVLQQQFDLQEKKALGSLPREILEAKLNELRSSGNESVDIPTDLVDANKKPVTLHATHKQLFDALYGASSNRGAVTQNQIYTQERHAVEDRAKEKESSKEFQSKIESIKKDKKPMVEDPEVQATVDMFNSTSTDNFAYAWATHPTGEHNIVFPNGPKTQAWKVPLPKVKNNGKEIQLTPKEISRRFPGMPMREALEQLQRDGVLKGKLPWQP